MKLSKGTTDSSPESVLIKCADLLLTSTPLRFKSVLIANPSIEIVLFKNSFKVSLSVLIVRPACTSLFKFLLYSLSSSAWLI